MRAAVKAQTQAGAGGGGSAGADFGAVPAAEAVSPVCAHHGAQCPAKHSPSLVPQCVSDAALSVLARPGARTPRRLGGSSRCEMGCDRGGAFSGSLLHLAAPYVLAVYGLQIVSYCQLDATDEPRRYPAQHPLLRLRSTRGARLVQQPPDCCQHTTSPTS